MPARLVQGQPNTGAHIVKVRTYVNSGRVRKTVPINPSLASEVLGVDVCN